MSVVLKRFSTPSSARPVLARLCLLALGLAAGGLFTQATGSFSSALATIDQTATPVQAVPLGQAAPTGQTALPVLAIADNPTAPPSISSGQMAVVPEAVDIVALDAPFLDGSIGEHDRFGLSLTIGGGSSETTAQITYAPNLLAEQLGYAAAQTAQTK